jgi:hypothetical protein
MAACLVQQQSCPPSPPPQPIATGPILALPDRATHYYGPAGGIVPCHPHISSTPQDSLIDTFVQRPLP